MSATAYLITPPFTQLNTPYPATAYLKGFLNTKNIPSRQSDLGIEVTLAVFSTKGLTEIFRRIEERTGERSANASRILGLKADYLQTIDAVILFLQGRNPTLAHQISKREFLPEASRFSQLDDLEWAFGSMGIQDKAKHLSTMYLEDLSDLIKECLDDHFGFSRYAEKLGRSANSFDDLYASLNSELTYIDEVMISLLRARITEYNPSFVAISVPFPGNLYSAFRCGQWIKANHPSIKIAMGGGFPNTELRSISDPRVFEFIDFITLDDGEAPIENVIRYTEGSKTMEELKRTFLLKDGVVTYINNTSCHDYKQTEVGTPDYSDFHLNDYISAIEVVNPMHRLWSDGRWNKLTMAHGCYWGKCTFCDISLDYIKVYEPIAAKTLCDRMEAMIEQTGENGFHFVDEAAPPALMRALAIEIIRRRMVVTWWTNVRFEKSFTRDLCLLLKASGCIAVSGGLEVASDRLLQLIQKGITVAQVARVTKNLTEAGIMVHAYLMYGFPTQTAQETIDSLEMVRQLFKAGILQSAFWHQFTMTAHSPVGLEPEKYQVTRESTINGSFANNDIVHADPTGTDHEAFAFGLKKSLFNFMHGVRIDDPVHKWFEFKAPKTSVDPDYIQNALHDEESLTFRPNAKVLWVGRHTKSEYYTQSKKGNQWEMVSLHFDTKRQSLTVQLPKEQGDWLSKTLQQVSINDPRTSTLQQLRESFESQVPHDFEMFWFNKPVSTLHKIGLLVV
ncbi:MAG: radical SAM protein [Chitinophagaceae bacterium]|nr:MAG: radical SAM protein [Chitinophagaceae bacterium]